MSIKMYIQDFRMNLFVGSGPINLQSNNSLKFRLSLKILIWYLLTVTMVGRV